MSKGTSNFFKSLIFLASALVYSSTLRAQNKCFEVFTVTTKNEKNEIKVDSQQLFLPQNLHQHKDGISALQDELLFTPFLNLDWQSWHEQVRLKPNLSYLPKMNSSSSLVKTLANLNLSDIIAKPGHMITRNPQKILWFGKNDPDLAVKREKRDQPDQAVLNVITDEDGKILFVDAWDGHHRLLGAMYAGKQKLSELHESGLKILLNGIDAEGNAQKTTPPAAGVDFRNAQNWKPLNGQPYVRPTRQQSRFADVWINGAVSNWDQGSVFTLKDLLESNLMSPIHSVGVARLALNESIDLRQITKLSTLGFDEILLVPSNKNQEQALSKKIVELNQQLQQNSIALRFNLYLGDAGGYISNFGEDSFLRRVQEAYITRAPPRFVNLETQTVLSTGPLGFEAPILNTQDAIISVGWQ